MDTTTPTVYTVAPDAGEEPTLWRGTAEDRFGKAVVTRRELDRMDPAFWPVLVAGLGARTPDQDTALDEEIREVYRFDGVIPAIRRYREHTHAGLREARAAVERICGIRIGPGGVVLDAEEASR